MTSWADMNAMLGGGAGVLYKNISGSTLSLPILVDIDIPDDEVVEVPADVVMSEAHFELQV